MPEQNVLCVDDEINVLSALSRLLRKETYRFLTAGHGAEGLAILEREPVQVVIADQRMPGMTGLEFLKQVKVRYPDTVRVVLSGTADVNVVLDAINHGEVFRFVTKPWNDEELKVTIRQCLSQYELIRDNNNLVELVRAQIRELRRVNVMRETKEALGAGGLPYALAVLDRLPMPVIAVAPGGVILANAAARSAIPALAGPPGLPIPLDALPPPLRELAARVDAQGQSAGSAQVIRLDGREVRARVMSLNESAPPGACILMLD